MLIPKGQLVHGHLSTSFTDVDQLIEGLRKKQFSGFCRVSFWEYIGVLFFEAGAIVFAFEELPGTRHDDAATPQRVLEKAREKDGELSVHQLPAATVRTLLASMNATPKHEGLSTDLTSLDRVISLLQKEELSGYIQVLFEEEAGVATLFFSDGMLANALFAPPDSQIVGEPSTVEAINGLCQKHGAVFYIFQSGVSAQALASQKTIPAPALRLFEATLAALETAADETLKTGAFQMTFKKQLPKSADSYPFLDPFIGDFRYASGHVSYDGDVTFGEFVDGVCDALAKTASALMAEIGEGALLLRLSRAMELICVQYHDLIEQLALESRLPQLFKDYFFWQDAAPAGEPGKAAENRKVLNLQGIGVSEALPENILREFYRAGALLAEKFANVETNTINYSQLKKSNEFKQYRAAATFLQHLNPSVLTDSQEQLAFWLNLYNFLALDGVIEYNIKASLREERGFFSKTTYRVGEYLFSLDDIEHGILRGNQRPPYSRSRQFESADPRNSFCRKSPDLRLQCCLHRFAKSSPPLVAFTAKQLDAQIEQAARRYFLTTGMRLEQATRGLWLSRLFYWYRNDVEMTEQTLVDMVAQALQGTPQGAFLEEHRADVTAHFLEFDWALNGK
ncbi:hypothetical protein U14_03412 [Candidatus Moduliflexus flocculans]|uniref:DUF547 domain-containing protein n=1 Tax=Candidatus Moduliflexus flocculans TaxID=1499966 RepID=A0A081BP45_9BACT|nr:hypothetical protein U14_03412 [Candidatus Moduliflexus flocculans]